MAVFSDDLFRMRGRVMSMRPELKPDFVNDCLNDRVRQLMDRRTFWADLLTPGVLSFPAPYSTGKVSVSTGSALIGGAATHWLVADVVNTTITAGVPEFGYVAVTPGSMTGITSNSYLYVDAGGTHPEVVPVVQTYRSSFIAKFEFPHPAGCSVTQSSMANRQLRMGESYPIFTIGAVTAVDGSGNNQALLTLPWGGPSLADYAYKIELIYIMLASDLKSLLAMKDEGTGYPVRIYVQMNEADQFDPQRSIVTGNPWFSVVCRGANDQGNLTWEMWPAPSDQRQFSYYYHKQWPEMVKDTDRPPPFINPSILVYGALADAKMLRTKPNDPYYDPESARYYEAKFDQGCQEARNADEAKVFTAMKSPWWKGQTPGNYDTFQLNDPAIGGFFGGGGW